MMNKNFTNSIDEENSFQVYAEECYLHMLLSQHQYSTTFKESHEKNVQENLVKNSVAGEINFFDFDIEDGLNDPISSIARNDFQARGLAENSDLEQDGKYFPYLYAYILYRFRQRKHRSRRNLRGQNLNLDDSQALATDRA